MRDKTMIYMQIMPSPDPPFITILTNTSNKQFSHLERSTLLHRTCMYFSFLMDTQLPTSIQTAAEPVGRVDNGPPYVEVKMERKKEDVDVQGPSLY